MPLKISQTVEEPHLNLTPMIDIVFLLIIFFMVGAQFTEQERQYDIQLPTVADVQPLTSRPDEIVVDVHGNGTIRLRGETVTVKQLEADLRAAKKNYVDQAVVVRGQGEGPYQHVMDVLTVCHRAKINHISLAHQLKRRDVR